MATSDRLESQQSMKGGISGIKNVLAGLKNNIKEAEDKATRAEEELAQVKKTYARAYTKQRALRDQITETEESLRKKEEKVKEIKKRLDDKELFLSEAAIFNKNLHFTTPKENAVAELEATLKQTKELYKRNNERYQHARNRKIALEDRFEIVEHKAHTAESRMKTLETELEYNIKEEARRSEGCRGAIDAAFRTEKSCLDLEKGLEIIMLRKDIATKKINSLEEKIAKADSALDTINFERRRVEATIKELLQNIKQQQAMS